MAGSESETQTGNFSQASQWAATGFTVLCCAVYGGRAVIREAFLEESTEK